VLPVLNLVLRQLGRVHRADLGFLDLSSLHLGGHRLSHDVRLAVRNEGMLSELLRSALVCLCLCASENDLVRAASVNRDRLILTTCTVDDLHETILRYLRL